MLNNQQQRAQRVRNERWLGSVQRVFVEEHSDGKLLGRTPHFRIVHFDGPAERIGRFVDVRITETGPNSLRGVDTSGAQSL